MAIAVNIRVSGFDVARFSEKMQSNLPKYANDEIYNYALGLTKKLQTAAITDPKRPITNNRRTAAMNIKARKQTNNKSVITMPRSLVYLDSMSPHYVSLKRGRNIIKWARQNYGTATVSGRSRVITGPRGGLKGSIYVTPHPFVQKTLNRERNKLPNYLRKSITKAYKASASYR